SFVMLCLSLRYTLFPYTTLFRSFVIPDILCNAGGVIVSYFEWVQGLQAFSWSETEVTDKLFRILEHSFSQVIRRAKAHKISHRIDRKSTRLNSSHEWISYAVFCL